jgi:hypothetical protein
MDSTINSQKNKAVRLIHHRSSSSSRKIDGENFSSIKNKIEKSSSDKRDLLLFSAPSSCLFFDRITVELNTLANNKNKKARKKAEGFYGKLFIIMCFWTYFGGDENMLDRIKVWILSLKLSHKSYFCAECS